MVYNSRPLRRAHLVQRRADTGSTPTRDATSVETADTSETADSGDGSEASKCCPISGVGTCAVSIGGSRAEDGTCALYIDAAPPCAESLNADGCPVLQCMGSCVTTPLPVITVSVDCQGACRSGRSYPVTLTSDWGPPTLTITSPCGSGQIEDNLWSPAACDGEATLTAKSCNPGGCTEASVTVTQKVLVGFDQPTFATTWQAGSEQVIRAMVAPEIGDLVLPDDILATLEVSIDGAAFEPYGEPAPLDWQHLARWRMTAPSATTIDLRATYSSSRAELPTDFAQLVARTSVAIAPSAQRSCTWTQLSASAAFPARDGAGALVKDGRMWLLGGWNPLIPGYYPLVTSNDVWSSSDGIEWRNDVPNAPSPDMWEARHTAGYTILGDAMYVLGGDLNQGHMQPDVWRSTDGSAWTRILAAAPWGERVLHITATLGDHIFVMGGQTLPQFGGPPETAFYNDVWRSPDGITWERIVEHAPWSARGQIGGQAVLAGEFFILGGGTYDTPAVPTRLFHNDVWSTPNGTDWTQRLAEAPWVSRQYHDVAAYDGRVWVLEGYREGIGNLQDAWYSNDGVSWYEVRDTPWAPRHASSIFVFGGGLWVVAGNNMESDVWKLTCGAVAPE